MTADLEGVAVIPSAGFPGAPAEHYTCGMVGVTERRRFRFDRCLGKGGFGEVYRAQMVTSSGLHRTVAVKTLHARLHGDDDAVRRLRDEARLLGALHHRGIVQVHDLVELQGQLALVTEYLDGEDLDRVLKRTGALPARVAVELVGEVAAALHTAYTTNAPGSDTPMRLVHRDIKPSNVRLTSKGAVKLLDFGIALSPTIDREAKTGTGLVIGTMGYLSPDRLTDESVDPSSDIYGLGCVLYEAVRRRRLYKDVGKAELFRLALDRDVHDAFIEKQLDLVPDDGAPLHPGVRELLTRTLAYDPTDRPTAAELEELCDDLAAELPKPHLRRWSRDRQWPEPAFETGSLDGLELSASGMIDTLAPPKVTDVSETAAPPPPPAAPAPPTGPKTEPYHPPAPGSGGPKLMAVIAIATVLVGMVGWFMLKPAPQAAKTELSETEGNGKEKTEDNGTDKAEGNGKEKTEGDGNEKTEDNGKEKTEDNGSNAAQNKPGVSKPPREPAPESSRPVPPSKPKPPPPPPKEERAEPGVVRFNSIPFSKEITVDGAQSVKAKEPVLLPPGTHSVVLRTGDGRSKTRSFTVTSGGKQVVCWNFEDDSPCG